MYRFKNTKYITITSMMIAILLVISLTTLFIKVGDSTIQFTTGFYLALCALMPGPSMLIVGIVYGALMDTINGGFIYIPATIMINVLMFLIVKFGKRALKPYGSFAIGALVLMIYVLYNYLINMANSEVDSIVIKEFIIDSIQYVTAVGISCLIYYVCVKRDFDKTLFKDNYKKF
ncbi:hypothetical protein [[Acholeplasma] multilocale]|uniref:hypothetical protein n=1 Tax=[Acholeplasma] multilocale TaxID=264638 RepID=UPI0003FA6EC6|nr:hypothetical protein [[Acholeplasma] multilocale]